jgi:hypothetical protein
MTYTESTFTENVHIHQLHKQQLIPQPAIQWFRPHRLLHRWLKLFSEFRNAWSHMVNLPRVFVAMYLTKHWKFTFLYSRLDSPSGPRLPHCWGFKIALRHTTLGRTPPDERSAHFRDLYYRTKHNTHKKQTPKRPTGFEPANPASELSQTHAQQLGSAPFLHFATLKLGGVNWT